MSDFAETIEELIEYKKGDIIPDPDKVIIVRTMPDSVLGILQIKTSYLVISRRTFTHILQKGKVGITLVNSFEKCLTNSDMIFLSDKNKSPKSQRLIFFKRNVSNTKDMAVVIEYDRDNPNASVITAMIADEKYLLRKYKKLR